MPSAPPAISLSLSDRKIATPPPSSPPRRKARSLTPFDWSPQVTTTSPILGKHTRSRSLSPEPEPEPEPKRRQYYYRYQMSAAVQHMAEQLAAQVHWEMRTAGEARGHNFDGRGEFLDLDVDIRYLLGDTKVAVTPRLFLGEYNQHHFGEWSPEPSPEVEAIEERIGDVVGEEGEFENPGSDGGSAHRGTPEEDEDDDSVIFVGERRVEEEDDDDESVVFVGEKMVGEKDGFDGFSLFGDGEELWEEDLTYGDDVEHDGGFEGSEEGEIVEWNGSLLEGSEEGEIVEFDDFFEEGPSSA